MSTNRVDTGMEDGNEFIPLPIDRAFLQVLRRLLQEAVQSMGLTSAALMLNAYGKNDRYLLLADQLAPEGYEAEEFIVSSLQSMALDDERFTLPDSTSVPVNWQGQRLGYLVALMPAPRRGTSLEVSGLERDLARLVRRYRLRQRLRDFYGEQSFWVGASRALCLLDDQILRLAQSGLPVLISAEPGCGKSLAARALHGYAFSEFRPFIESNCADWSGRALRDLLSELWANARTGSLYLRNVDRLPLDQLNQVLAFWQTERERSIENRLPEVRLLVSTDSSDSLGAEGLASLVDWLEFNALELRLPTLRERRADIRALGEYFVNEYRLGQGFDFDEDAWELLEAYPWPGNVQQFKSMIQKLAVVADTSLVTSGALARWFPSLGPASRPQVGPTQGVQEPGSREQEGVSLHSLFGGLRELKWEHPGLVRALDYMLTYHRHPLTSEHVSSAVKLPQQQLTQLLKYRLGMSFEQMMGKIRVEQAKNLFRQDPSQLPAEVGQAVGYGNLDVFEQAFRRLVGLSPQAYRSQFFRPLSLVR